MLQRPLRRPGLGARLAAIFGLDLRSLAAFRIALAGVVIVDLVARWPSLAALYSDEGVLPLALANESRPHPSLHALSGAPAFQVGLHLAALGFATMLALGWRTRLATFGTWLLLLSLQYRNVYVTDGGDVLATKLLLWGLFLPLGARASIDARRRPPPDRPVELSPATVGFLFEFIHFYVVSGLVKSAPEWASTGTALQQVLGQSYWTRPAGEVLGQYPELLRALTPTVRYVELLVPWLLVVPVFVAPLRCLVIGVFWALQLGLGLTIDLHLFPWYSSVATLALVPRGVWERLGARPRAAAARHVAPARLPHFGAQVPAGLLLALFLLHLAGAGRSLPGPVRRAADALHVTHRWSMYATPPWFDFRFDAVGTLADGRTIDLLATPGDADWERVRAVHATYRFRYLLQKIMRKPEAFFAPYLEWLCRRWNAGAPERSRLIETSLFITGWDILPRSEPHRFQVATRGCPEGA